MDSNRPIAVSIPEAAQLAGLGRSSLYMAIKNHHLKVRKAGRRSLVEIAELQRFVSSLPTSA